MKLKAIIGCVLVVAMLTVATPVLALSIGVSPTRIELEVPGDGTATANLQIYYFTGDVDISLIDIPLRVGPSTIHVEASENPVAIELTIYGDSSLGSQIYDGYIRFIAVSGGAATGGVQVIARITNLVEGETPVPATPEESQIAPEEIVETALPDEEAVTAEEDGTLQEEDVTLPEGEEAVSESTSQGSSFPVILVAGIAAGAIIITTLIIVIARRYQY